MFGDCRRERNTINSESGVTDGQVHFVGSPGKGKRQVLNMRLHVTAQTEARRSNHFRRNLSRLLRRQSQDDYMHIQTDPRLDAFFSGTSTLGVSSWPLDHCFNTSNPEKATTWRK